MNNNDLINDFRKRGCLPYQAEFAARMLSDSTTRIHVLRAPPGMGKAFLVASLCSYLTNKGSAHRVLVLCHPALGAQFRELFIRAGTELPVQIIDRRRFRELEAETEKPGRSIFAAPGIQLMPASLAVRNEVSQSLLETNWDLVVVDEANRTLINDESASVLGSLLKSNQPARMLLLASSIVSPRILSAIRQIAGLPVAAQSVTAWTPKQVRDWDGVLLLPEVRFIEVDFRRSQDETEFLAFLASELDRLVQKSPETRQITATMLNAASSSQFAIEQRLIHLRRAISEDTIEPHSIGLRTRLIDGWPNDFEALSKLEASLVGQSGNFIEQCIGVLETIQSDAKLEALRGLFNESQPGSNSGAKICIFTQFAETARYLGSSLTSADYSVLTVTSGMNIEAQAECFAKFQEGGGVLILSDAASLGLDLSGLKAIIHYDLSTNPAVIAARNARANRLGKGSVLTIYTFRDISDVLEVEREQQKVFKSVKEELIVR